ncbi:MAG: iron-containing alcohol dehydrogenase [Selenomonadales bacterium]|nr:iron-containing alcohol dehydrogenase [Selenomonadales bacterium]
MKSIIFGGKIITGRGSLAECGKLAGTRVMIVTGSKSVIASGALDRLKRALGKDRAVEVYMGVTKNPTTKEIEQGTLAMRAFAPDTVIAIGGGSPMDAAKVMVMMYEYPDLTFEEAAKGNIPAKRNTMLIAIPTTSGTASEVTRAAVVTYEDKNIKIGLKSEAFIPDVAILDAETTVTMPKNVVAETGMDALTHAVEAYCNHNLDRFTAPLAEAAICGILGNIVISYETGSLDAREIMHECQAMAGLAFTNVGLGMSHGIAHAVGGKFDLGHGLINAIVLPYALRYNEKDPDVAEKLARFEDELGMPLADVVDELNDVFGIPRGLGAAGIKPDDYIAGWDDFIHACLSGSTKSNPRAIDFDTMSRMMEAIYDGEPFEEEA